MKKYKIIYADPAWVYKDKANAGNRGAIIDAVIYNFDLPKKQK